MSRKTFLISKVMSTLLCMLLLTACVNSEDLSTAVGTNVDSANSEENTTVSENTNQKSLESNTLAESSGETEKVHQGELTVNINGGAYWGYTGLDPFNSVQNNTLRLGDVITETLTDICKTTGYDIRIDLYKNLDGIVFNGENLPTEMSVEGLMDKTITYFSSDTSRQIIIVYIGERNEVEVSIVGETDFAIDSDAIKAAFCNEEILDPIERVKTAVEILACELEATTSKEIMQ